MEHLLVSYIIHDSRRISEIKELIKSAGREQAAPLAGGGCWGKQW
jgi:hypothetical protein